MKTHTKQKSSRTERAAQLSNSNSVLIFSRILAYISALVAANYLVLYMGRSGLLITASVLIPFDFVVRCSFHERWKGKGLLLRLGSLILLASSITFLINKATLPIALGSAGGFIGANITAGIFYQLFIGKNYLIKVNGSDIVGIMTDSILFQLIAFGSISWTIWLSQTVIKFCGGLFWYYVIFHRHKWQP